MNEIIKKIKRINMKRLLIAAVCLLAFFGGTYAQQTKTLKVIDNAEQLVKKDVELPNRKKVVFC